jgi:dTDP-4-dehydrorhamnose 3,5-epimerase
MKIFSAGFRDVYLIEPGRFSDRRGWFAELWNRERYCSEGLCVEFVQTNASYSRNAVLRGMHFQHPRGQAKLVSVLHGSVFDVIVDVRIGSPTFGDWYGCELSADNRLQLFVPAGFAHGFLVTGEDALVHYNCSAVYDPSADQTLAWDDSAVGIDWPATPEIVSEKDRAAASLQVLAAAGHLPHYEKPQGTRADDD